MQLARSIRIAARRLLWHLMTRSSRQRAAVDLGRSAMVFSPHFDDECLGCGGTILSMRRQGSEVKIVFMTDGSKSHRHLMPEDELRCVRAAEGRAAAEAIGVDCEDVFLLGFEETRLADHAKAAIAAVVGLLNQHQPDAVFIPSPYDFPADHVATGRIVRAAMVVAGSQATVYEYPIWFWRTWPWTPWPAPWSQSLRETKWTLIAALRLLREYRIRVPIADVLAEKRAALVCHRSQVERLVERPDWSILADVSDGEFLACFLRDYEFFGEHAP
jgi:LmbE family N-acetylglucosaminyl deacetylase